MGALSDRLSPVGTVVEGLVLDRRQVTAVLVPPSVVEPVDPFESGETTWYLLHTNTVHDNETNIEQHCLRWHTLMDSQA